MGWETHHKPWCFGLDISEILLQLDNHFCSFEDINVKSERMTSEGVVTKEMEEEEKKLMEEGERREEEMMKKVWFLSIPHSSSSPVCLKLAIELTISKATKSSRVSDRMLKGGG